MGAYGFLSWLLFIVCVADCFGVVWCCLGGLWMFVLVSVL